MLDAVDILAEEIREKSIYLTPAQKLQAYADGNYGELYLSLMPLIFKYATGFSKQQSDLVPEYYSAGTDGFMRGCTNERFDEEKGSFNTFIVYYIKGAMLRLHKQRRKQILSESDTNANFCEIPARSSGSTRRLIVKDFVRTCVASTSLTDSERNVLFKYYIQHESIQKIATKLGVSKQAVSQTKQKAVLKLRQNRSTCAVMGTK